jgi:DNA-3-methyladenine glycosylase
MKLPLSFYQNPDVVDVARKLLGKVLFTRFNRQLTGGIITETEAYNGIIDKASHAYGDRHTPRTTVMYQEGGVAYVYLCYGIHSLFNVVTNREGIPHAVLIRSVAPYWGEQLMRMRRNMQLPVKGIYEGPGKVSMALGIHHSQTGEKLTGNKIWIEDKGIIVPPGKIIITPRIGVDYAGADALLPYRFLIREQDLVHS